MDTHTPSPLDALKPLAGRALQLALNRSVALDPDTREALRGLDGRSVELSLAAPALAMRIRSSGGLLEVGPVDGTAPPDLSISGTLSGLLGQFELFRPRTGGVARGGLRVSGDADLARELQRLVRGFDPDFDKPFADAFGEVVGAQVARVLREGLRQGRGLAAGLVRDGAEYVVEEREDVANRVDIEVFNDDVDTLREDVERMTARVLRLKARIEADATGSNSPDSSGGGR